MWSSLIFIYNQKINFELDYLKRGKKKFSIQEIKLLVNVIVFATALNHP